MPRLSSLEKDDDEDAHANDPTGGYGFRVKPGTTGYLSRRIVVVAMAQFIAAGPDFASMASSTFVQ
jgi:hypothetical protein